MKKTLKVWKELAAEKKAAWVKSKGKGIQGAELAKLKDEYLKYQDVVDNAEAEGAKDADEIEVSKKDLGLTEAKKKDAPAADEDEEVETIGAKELTRQIVEAVESAFAKRSENEREQVTAESIKTIVKEVLAEHMEAGQKEVKVSDVKSIFSDVLKEQEARIKKGSKMRHGQEARDEDNDDEGRDDQAFYKSIGIEIPVGPRKGNLPLHQKQLLNRVMGKHQDEGIDRVTLERGDRLGEFQLNKYQQMARAGQKALTSTGSGTGDEWVPTNLASELLRRTYLSSQVNAIMAGSEIDMPTEPYTYPLSTTRPTFYGQPTENTATTASTPGTAQPSLASKKFMAQVDFSYEIAEDSIIPILPNLQTLLAEAAGDAFEHALINGDTTGTHQDSDTDAITNDAAKQFKGWRKLALAVSALKSDISSGGLNEANLRAMVKLAGIYGIRTTDLMWIVGSKGINDIKGIANVATADKTGSPATATLLTGEISTLLGIPLIVSARCRENLNASGVYDGTTTTKGSVLLVNKSQFLTGRRREFTVEIDRDITLQKNILVASFRKGMIPMETPSASISSVIVGYNYTA